MLVIKSSQLLSYFLPNPLIVFALIIALFVILVDIFRVVNFSYFYDLEMLEQIFHVVVWIKVESRHKQKSNTRKMSEICSYLKQQFNHTKYTCCMVVIACSYLFFTYARVHCLCCYYLLTMLFILLQGSDG